MYQYKHSNHKLNKGKQMKNKESIYQHVASFYAKGGLYYDQVKATKAQVINACNYYISTLDPVDFYAYGFDSVDRERVRAILENPKESAKASAYNELVRKTAFQRMQSILD